MIPVVLIAAACGGANTAVDQQPERDSETTDALSSSDSTVLDAADRAVIDRFLERISARIYDPVNPIKPEVIEDLGQLDDDRLAWLVADALRFVGRGPEFDALVQAGTRLGGIPLSPQTAWLALNNHLLAEDRPEPEDYRSHKQQLYVAVDATWSPFFEDDGTTVDWRAVSFGGVLADRRPFGSEETCQCIAAIDDPPAAAADDVPWLSDGDLIIGVTVDGAKRAYPLHIMETHELVNDKLGGRRMALAYCTLCGSGQAYLVDQVPDRYQPVVLRTSGLLHRSNKIMFDLNSRSMIDTFSGQAFSGPWRADGITLEPVTTVTSEWGAWRDQHPDTTVMAGLAGAGAAYPLDPLGGRDDGGPIFPIGSVDDRLFPQTDVVGVITSDRTAVAFPLVETRRALRAGTTVTVAGVTVESEGSGLRASGPDGESLVSHQAYWFAWSQFHPETEVWTG